MILRITVKPGGGTELAPIAIAVGGSFFYTEFQVGIDTNL